MGNKQKILIVDDDNNIAELISLYLIKECFDTQIALDGEEALDFDSDTALDSVQEFLKAGTPSEITDFFLTLEVLTPEWKQLLQNPSPAPWTDHHRALVAYLVQRYWLQAVSDYDLYCRVKFVIITCLLVKHLGGDIFRTAQLFSKEIENSIDNVEAILDAAYAHPTFTDDKILGMLLK